MLTWEDFKEELKNKSDDVRELVENTELATTILCAMVTKRIECGYSQRDLAELCGLPHSTIARIESCRVSPKLDTLIKILSKLGLKLTITTI